MMNRENVLDVQADMLAELTPEQRARYAAELASHRVTANDPNGLVYCDGCGWMYDPQAHAAHRCNGRKS